jgi:choline-sulfatase
MASKNPDKPNIIYILTDDQGAWALGCYGNKDLITPNIDRLAAEGMRFTNFFCTSPVCSPARASILTGCIPSQHGVHDWIREGNSGEKGKSYLEGIRGYTEDLAAQGYTCGISGKWHLGNSLLPQKGFSHWYVHQQGGGDYYGAPMIRNGKEIIETEYITDLITDDAMEFISNQVPQETPFYLSINYTAPHTPWLNQHPKKFVDLYDECQFESCPREKPHPWNLFVKVPDAIPKSILEDPTEHLKGYYGAISAMDDNVGRVMKQIDELGLRESTLICFMSDNGFNCGHHGIWGKGNGTYPQNMYDTSVKVPAVFSQPAKIPQGVVSDAMLSGYDVMPTLLSYVSVPYTDASRPGKDFTQILTGKRNDVNDAKVVVYDEYGPVRMIRSHEWKYVHRFPEGPHELYHLSEDPDEKVNLVDLPEHAGTIKDMKNELDGWFSRYVVADKDGLREPVTGKGQTDFVGSKRMEEISFTQ